ncbi:hypothetical protein [Roseisalinus antarcticus]|uniref:Lipoprotein LpqN n=1 Tax=Roseisalinus antarcticus TaxID=254357 RepID=A0A1Y5RB56_9RHOB|nr:hypothetical protein [Roseisalinus antarcticus]SLN13001.1 hypothetical protein ROA7023_00022 [Roseisalinus antarcticus]
MIRVVRLALPLVLALAAAPAQVSAAESCVDIAPPVRFCPAGLLAGLTPQPVTSGLSFGAGDTSVIVQWVPMETAPLTPDELRLMVSDMAEILIGEDASTLVPLIEDRPALPDATPVRFAFRTGAYGAPRVFVLSMLSAAEGVVLIQSSAPGEYLDEAHSALHMATIASVEGVH